jgi:hypothetical protein
MNTRLADQITAPARAVYSARSAAVEALSWGGIISTAMLRARVRYCGVRMDSSQSQFHRRTEGTPRANTATSSSRPAPKPSSSD